jgi:prophage regulatory protein
MTNPRFQDAIVQAASANTAPLFQRKLVNFKQLRAMGISWSREHVWRLEAKNKFPRRIYLSPQKVAWFEDEVLQWLEARAAERNTRIYRSHD